MKKTQKTSFYVYKHTSPSGKVYIGITCQKPEHRWNNGRGYMYNRYFTSAIQKYGWENIKHEILVENLSQDQASALEMQLIKEYDSCNPAKGYNATFGGECEVPSDSAREKMSIAKMGKPAHNKGKKLPESWLQHLKEAHANVSTETRAKQRAAKLGKHLSDSAKAKISGCNNVNFGKPSPNRKAVKCIDTGIVYQSIKHAAEHNGATIQGVSACCNGKAKSTRGLRFEFEPAPAQPVPPTNDNTDNMNNDNKVGD